MSVISVKMNFGIITKNHADDSKIKYPQKIDFRADETHESQPTAWELIKKSSLIIIKNICNVFLYVCLFKQNIL